MKLYTRTGDQGMTCLASLDHVSKNHRRIHAVGDTDELSSVIGVALCFNKDQRLHHELTTIQRWLIGVAAELAGAPQPSLNEMTFEQAIAMLETCIDHYSESTGPLRTFLLPGGSPTSAHLHHARTVCRRLERDIVALIESDLSSVSEHKTEPVRPELLQLINRLSDYLFAAARAHADARAVVSED